MYVLLSWTGRGRGEVAGTFTACGACTYSLRSGVAPWKKPPNNLPGIVTSRWDSCLSKTYARRCAQVAIMQLNQIERVVCCQKALRLRPPRSKSLPSSLSIQAPWMCRHSILSPRNFTSSTHHNDYHRQYGRGSFGSRLRTAWRGTKIEWYPIPVGLGIGFLGLAQLYRVRQRDNVRQAEEENERTLSAPGDNGEGSKPKKRRRIRPSGPWYADSD